MLKNQRLFVFKDRKPIAVLFPQKSPISGIDRGGHHIANGTARFIEVSYAQW